MLRLLAASALVPVLALAGLAASSGCGAGDVNPPPLLTASDGGGDDAPTIDAPAGAITQGGKIIDFSTFSAIVGAKVTSGASSATTDTTGAYSFSIPPNTIFNMTVENTGFYTLQEQEAKAAASFNLGKTKFLSENTAKLLLTTLTGYDGKGGIVSVALENHGCPDEGGATFEWAVDGQPGGAADAGPGTGRLIYASDGFPDGARTSAQSGSFPHAIVYNVTPGKAVSITAKHPSCKMIAFPVDKDLTVESGSGTITYTSATLTPLGGKVTGFVRIFLSN
jgi:hypothetical protein